MRATADDQKQISFVQHQLPGLDAGEYVVSLGHEVVAGMKASYDTQYTFLVRADRFALAPSDVYGVFPPDQSGDHMPNELPHVVFNQRTLPWDRELAGVALQDKDRVPWLALLLLDAADLAQCTYQQRRVIDLTAKGYTNTGKDGSTITADIDGDTLSNLTDNAFVDDGEFFADAVMTIQLPAETFNAVAPTLADLAKLAHVRHVDLTKKAARLSGRLGDPDDLPVGEFAIIAGNRMPTPGVKNTVHLVSLEGFGNYLPGEKADGTPISNIDTTKISKVRLVSLYTWSYTAVDVTKTQAGRPFKALLESLNQVENASAALALSPSLNGDATLVNSFAMGYAPLVQQLRQGGRTICWYRGPLRPSPGSDPSSPNHTPLENADAALRYNPDTSMFDVSRAAAWQLGRLLCLRDRALAQSIYTWKQANKHAQMKAFSDECKASVMPPGSWKDALVRALSPAS